MKSKSQLIAEQVPVKSAKVVDIGFAQLSNNFLLKEGRNVWGVDIKPAFAEGYTGTFVCDLNKDVLPFKTGEIDVVTMGCVLAHVAKPLKVLAEINRVLPMDGLLIMSSPNPNYYWETVLNIFYNSFKDRVAHAKHDEHLYSFSRYTMRTVARRAGFEVINEVGVTFALVKTPLRFNPIRFPGLSYEIIYVLKKVGTPQNFTTFEGASGEEEIVTELYE